MNVTWVRAGLLAPDIPPELAIPPPYSPAWLPMNATSVSVGLLSPGALMALATFNMPPPPWLARLPSNVTSVSVGLLTPSRPEVYIPPP